MIHSQCTVLFNLNTYLGGGETLLIRFANFLKRNNYPFRIVSYGLNGWVASEAISKGYDYDEWPHENDSLSYEKDVSKELIEFFRDEYSCFSQINIFTFCMRDLVNVIKVFSKIPSLNVRFFHGIYHPDDYKYLSSLSINKKKYIKINRKIFTWLYEHKAILFMNEFGLKENVNKINKNIEPILAPIPIEISEKKNTRALNKKNKIRIITISRFSSGKVGSILALLRASRKRKNIEVTVVGHGSWGIVLKIWVAIFRLKNINFIHDARPEDLPELINQSDIGYAQGTSILEIAKFSVPVIIAPYSLISDIFNAGFKAIGIFGSVEEEFQFGDRIRKKTDPGIEIVQAIDEILEHYPRYSKLSFEQANNFSSEKIFANIFKSILGSQASNQKGLQYNMRPPLLKVFIKKLLKAANF